MHRRTDKRSIQLVEDRFQTLFMAGLEGDSSAYRDFLDQLSAHLRAFLRRRLSDAEHDVEDILQETLLAVHNARHTYRTDQPLAAWLYAITRYKLADFYRSRARRASLDLPLEPDWEMLESADTESANASEDIERLLRELPERYRLPIVHTRLQGLSVSETAALTGMSQPAVKVGVHRGLKALVAKVKGTS